MTITRIKQRRGTAAAWTAANPTLDSAEFGVETDTGKIKLGDGSTAWTALDYLLNVTDLRALLDGTYVGVADALPLIGAAALSSVLGTPSLSNMGSGRLAAWLLDGTANEGVGYWVEVPAGWATIAIDVYWANTTATAGDVAWVADTKAGIAETTLLSGYTANTAVVEAAGLQDVLVVTTLVTGVAVTPGTILAGRVYRNAANALDTLNGIDIGLLAIKIRRVS